MINLLSNAVKFTDSGSVILQLNQSGDSRFMFEVIDTGIGIAPEEKESVFSLFTQSRSGTSRGGTGMGLAIASRLVGIMGGELDLESEPGKGSRFFFILPLEAATEVAVARSLLDQRGFGLAPIGLAEGYSVLALVADDNKENRDVFSRMLSDIGVSVITAEDGQQAVEMTISDRPDIVFMDIWMPVMDGLKAAQQILLEFGEDRPKLVAVSASALSHEQQQYRDAGFDHFVPKPVKSSELYACLAELLQVEYEYEADVPFPGDAPEMVLPRELLARLKETAELGHVAEFEGTLDEVRAIGEDGLLLAEQLLRLSRNFDMERILDILRAIENE